MVQGFLLFRLYTTFYIIFAFPQSQFAIITTSNVPIGKVQGILPVWKSFFTSEMGEYILKVFFMNEFKFQKPWLFSPVKGSFFIKGVLIPMSS